MPDSAPLTLDSVSVLLVWTAIAVYALAFIAYAVDLARRSAQVVDTKDARERRAGRSCRGLGRVERDRAVCAQKSASRTQALNARPADRRRQLWARIGTSLTVLAFLFHVAGDVTRGIAAGRVPWSNMYEFSLTGTMLVVAVYLAVLFRYDLRFLGSFITGSRRAAAGRCDPRVLRRDRAADGSAEERVARHPRLRRVARDGAVRPRVRPLGDAADAGAARAQSPRRRRVGADGVDRRPDRASCGPCRAPRRSSRSRTGSRSSASSSGPSRSSPARSGRTTRGVATGASTPRKCGRSSSGCSTPATSMRARHAAGGAPGRRGCRSSASLRCCSASRSSTCSSRAFTPTPASADAEFRDIPQSGMRHRSPRHRSTLRIWRLLTIRSVTGLAVCRGSRSRCLNFVEAVDRAMAHGGVDAGVRGSRELVR